MKKIIISEIITVVIVVLAFFLLPLEDKKGAFTIATMFVPFLLIAVFFLPVLRILKEKLFQAFMTAIFTVFAAGTLVLACFEYRSLGESMVSILFFGLAGLITILSASKLGMSKKKAPAFYLPGFVVVFFIGYHTFS